MGHDEHFLERLERVDPGQVEMALSLYYDSALVQFILGAARVPDSAKRVAISLEDPDLGPFVVVTREGDFVTCLGRGMAAPSLPVVARARLDELTAEATRVRERLKATAATVAAKGGISRIVERVWRAGENLCREEFAAVAAWEPLLHPELVRIFFRLRGPETRSGGEDARKERPVPVRERKEVQAVLRWDDG